MAELHPIPLAALDDRLGFVGTAGSGKTYNAGTGIERVLSTGGRAIIPDPLGVWWGLGLCADGKTPAPWREKGRLVIFGGEHGDLPLNERAGALIGETVAGMAESAILDLSGFGTKAAERRFMLAFLTALYRHAVGEPLHLVFDEADMWAPQRLLDKEGDAAKLLGMIETVVRRGRIKGFIPWLISQRPAVLSKDVLSQVDGLVAFKLTSSQDRKAIGAWVEGQADEGQWREIHDALPTLPRGTGVVWLPGRGILETACFPAKITFDSSRTPKRGERVERRALKPLDLGKLKGCLSSIEDEAKANDPKALKLEVAQLTRALNLALKRVGEPSAAPPPVVANADQVRQDGERAGIAIGITRAQQALAALRVDGAPTKAPKRAVGQAAPVVDFSPLAHVVPAEGLGGPQQKILNSLAWWKALGFDQITNEQTAFIADYSPKSTSYQKARGALKSFSLIDYPSSGVLALTAGGEDKAQAPETPPTPDELRRRVLGRLGGPQQRILAALIDAHPDELTNEECASRSDYSPLSTSYQKARGALKSLKAIAYPSSGKLRAADWLFP